MRPRDCVQRVFIMGLLQWLNDFDARTCFEIFGGAEILYHVPTALVETLLNAVLALRLEP